MEQRVQTPSCPQRRGLWTPFPPAPAPCPPEGRCPARASPSFLRTDAGVGEERGGEAGGPGLGASPGASGRRSACPRGQRAPLAGRLRGALLLTGSAERGSRWPAGLCSARAFRRLELAPGGPGLPGDPLGLVLQLRQVLPDGRLPDSQQHHRWVPGCSWEDPAALLAAASPCWLLLLAVGFFPLKKKRILARDVSNGRCGAGC